VSGTRIAILHDDPEFVLRAAQFAAELGLELLSPASAADLEALLTDPLIAAVLLDITGPRSGGFELVQRTALTPARPQVIVATALDAATMEAIARLGQAKGLNLRVLPITGDESALRACLAALPKRETHFGPQHLSEAIDRNYLSVEYQPKVPLDGGDGQCSVEALCRLEHPQFGQVYPDRFIPMAEQQGLIARLTDFVVCRAFRDLGRWRDQGFKVRLALNISPELLKTPEWCDHFLRRSEEFAIAPDWITLEITESVSGAILDVAFETLTRLRREGFLLSIDDFGTGFSSLAALYKLPFSELKIDKSFTFDLQKLPGARALVESTIGIARRMGMNVVAEGVETESVFRELRLMGCQHAQGYFISKSIPAEHIPQFFAGWDRPEAQASWPEKKLA
jgi:EAL domain-containing protein (putative c-di-GMP-specific phosphodiesterase class I)